MVQEAVLKKVTFGTGSMYDHTGLLTGYQSIAKYHKDMDTVVVQFVNTTHFDGYTWSLSEIVYSRIIKMLK